MKLYSYEAGRAMWNGGYFDLEEEIYIPPKECLYPDPDEYSDADYEMFRKNPERYLRAQIANWIAFDHRAAVKFGYPKELLLEKGFDPDKEFEPLLTAPDCFEDNPNYMKGLKMDIDKSIEDYMMLFSNFIEYKIEAEKEPAALIFKWLEEHNIEIIQHPAFEHIMSKQEEAKKNGSWISPESARRLKEISIFNLLNNGGYYDIIEKEYIKPHYITSDEYKKYERNPERYLKPQTIDRVSLNAQAATDIGITVETLKECGVPESRLTLKMIPQGKLEEMQENSRRPTREETGIYGKLYVYLEKKNLVNEFSCKRDEIEKKIVDEWKMANNVLL